MSEAKFVRIHRNQQYKPNQKKPRDIIVCFWDFNERCAVLSGKMEMAKGIFVNQDFPPAVVFAERTLIPIRNIVKGTPYGERKRTKLIAGVLYVDGKRYTLQNLVTLAETIKFYQNHIKSNWELLVYFGILSIYSNLFWAPMVIDGKDSSSTVKHCCSTIDITRESF